MARLSAHEAARRARIEALVVAARRLADGTSELGRRARRLLLESSGLSAENIEWALAHALETSPSPAELDSLLASVEPARAAFVILPANVFVAAHRAVALALAASPAVRVRPSRREPHFARLLCEAAPGLFELVDEIAPESGDHVCVYGGDAALKAVHARLPAGTRFEAHGPGFGVALIDASAVTPSAARALAVDVAAFDQRGCLSPRLACVLGDAALARRFGELLADALAQRARDVPRGRLDATEMAEIARFRGVAAYAGALLPAGPGFVAVMDGAKAPLAPVGRHLAVVAAPNFESARAAFDSALVTAAGVAGPAGLASAVRSALPAARVSELGCMQCPRFDGPADRRVSVAVVPP